MTEPKRTYYRTGDMQVPDPAAPGGWRTVSTHRYAAGETPAAAAYSVYNYRHPSTVEEPLSEGGAGIFELDNARRRARADTINGRVVLTDDPIDYAYGDPDRPSAPVTRVVLVRDAVLDHVARIAAASRAAAAAYAEATKVYRRARLHRDAARFDLEEAERAARAAGIDPAAIRRAKTGPRKPRQPRTNKPRPNTGTATDTREEPRQ